MDGFWNGLEERREGDGVPEGGRSSDASGLGSGISAQNDERVEKMQSQKLPKSQCDLGLAFACKKRLSNGRESLLERICEIFGRRRRRRRRRFQSHLKGSARSSEPGIHVLPIRCRIRLDQNVS